MRVMVLDRPLVLARTPDGQAFALEDRCPHRGAPLSAGKMIGDVLQCPYHGWKFNSSGRCTSIPGLLPEDSALGVGAKCIRVHEINGFIWVHLGENDGNVRPAPLESLATGAPRLFWQETWNCAAVDALEDFLDPMHTHFVHRGLVRTADQRRSVQATTTTTADGFVVRYQGLNTQSGLMYRLFESERAGESAEFSAPGSARLNYAYLNGSAISFTLHFTPESRQSTRVAGVMQVSNRFAPHWLLRLIAWPFIRRILREDKNILELQSSNLNSFATRRHVVTAQDLVRRRLDHYWSDVEAAKTLPPEDTVVRLML